MSAEARSSAAKQLSAGCRSLAHLRSEHRSGGEIAVAQPASGGSAKIALHKCIYVFNVRHFAAEGHNVV